MPGSDESDNVSLKLLLKQVYNLHNSRVRELENTVKDLKEKLLEKEKQLQDAQLNCKKCCELEEVIKSCKAALYEQSKLFENLGEKFSLFGNLEKEHVRNPSEISKNSEVDVQDTISQASVKVKSNFEDEKTFEKKSCQSLSFTDTVINVTTKKQNLLQNVMIDTLEESFCLGSTSNPSTLMPNDSLILAPDTLDIDMNIKAKCSKSIIKTEKSFKKPDSHVNEYFKEQNSFIESTKDSESAKPGKRLSSESSGTDKSSKKCKLEIETLGKRNDNESSKTFLPKDNAKEVSSYNLRNKTNPVVSKEKVETKAFDAKSDVKEVLPSETTIAQDENMPSRILKNSKSLEDSTFRTLNCTKENVNQASPSLLPLNTNHNNINETADSDDFQPSNGKYKENNSLKETNDRKKLTKKVQCMKPVKTSSKFKMTLDAPPLDYKKPSYRQTKLSKTIFQPHSKNTTLQTSVLKKGINAKKTEEGNNVTSPTRNKAQDFCFSDKQESRTIDFDATCIPENFKFEFTPCGKFNSKQSEQNKLTMSFDESILMLDNKSENKVLKLPCEYDILKKSPKSAQKIEKNSESSSEDKSYDAKENMNSFDKLPLPEEPKYKYKEETVRKKAERRQLAGYDCKECEKYYSDLGLSDEEKQQRLKKCSRHRAKFVPPSTPEHFWELDFPDTQECKARGYLNETQKMKLKFLTS